MASVLLLDFNDNGIIRLSDFLYDLVFCSATIKLSFVALKLILNGMSCRRMYQILFQLKMNSRLETACCSMPISN